MFFGFLRAVCLSLAIWWSITSIVFGIIIRLLLEIRHSIATILHLMHYECTNSRHIDGSSWNYIGVKPRLSISCHIWQDRSKPPQARWAGNASLVSAFAVSHVCYAKLTKDRLTFLKSVIFVGVPDFNNKQRLNLQFRSYNC